MKPLYFLTAGLCLCTFSGYAQKDAPVAGHAAALVDLLKKDYSAISPDVRDDEIIKDRAQVISIFKAYLPENTIGFFDKNPSKTLLCDANARLVESLKKFNVAKNSLAVFLNTTVSLSGANITIEKKDTVNLNKILIDDLSTKRDKLAKQLEESKKGYYDASLEVDLILLREIEKVYTNSNNAFVVKVLNDFINKYEALHNLGSDTFAAVNYNSSVQKSIPFIGGDLAFETVIDGLSRFLVKRIKEELTNYVIEVVQEWLQNPEEANPFTELKVLLPITTEYLIGFRADRVTSFPGEFKQYIEKDLNNLLPNTANLRNTPRIRKLVAQNPELDFAFEALETIPNLSKIKNPVDYFKLVENSRNISRWQNLTDTDPPTIVRKNIANLMKLSCLLAQSMTFIDNGELRFAGADFMGSYASEKNFQLLFWGFITQQSRKYHSIKIDASGSPLELTDKLNDLVITANNLDPLARKNSFIDLLVTMGNNAEKISVYAAEIRKANKTGARIGADTAYNFVDAMIGLSENLVQSAEGLLELVVDSSISLHKNLDSYFAIARSSNSMLFDIRQKRYASALLTGLKLAGNPDSAASAPSQLLGQLHQLGDLRLDKNLKAWKTVLGIIDRTPTGTLTDDPLDNGETDAFLLLSNEITRAGIFSALNYNTTDTRLNDLKLFFDRCADDKKFYRTEWNTGDLSIYVSEPEFKQLIVGFYTNVPLEKFLSTLANELREITYTNTAGSQVNLLGSSGITNMSGNIGDYANALFDHYIRGANKRESNFLASNRKRLANEINTYFSLVAPKFNIANNPRVVSLVHFVNDLALAEDAEDVEHAIEAFALPSGSFSIKREGVFNVSVNSYPGLLLAYDNPLGVKAPADTLNPAFSTGFTAPVGLSIAKGTRKGRSMGVFIPLIDVGAVTRFRFDDETSKLPELKFGNMFSPGVFFHWGCFRKNPLSLNVGVQYGPEIRKLNDQEKSWESIRIGAGLVLDIPLFNLYNKPRFAHP